MIMSSMYNLFLKRSMKPLYNAICFRLSNKPFTDAYAPIVCLVHKPIRKKLSAVIYSQFEPSGNFAKCASK